MGIKFGEVDSSQILENEFRIGVLERLLDFILVNNSFAIKPSQAQIEEIRQSVVEILQKKYPNSGITFKQK
jgi:hypothetical protein